MARVCWRNFSFGGVSDAVLCFIDEFVLLMGSAGVICFIDVFSGG
jgi:hypothetical protein